MNRLSFTISSSIVRVRVGLISSIARTPCVSHALRTWSGWFFKCQFIEQDRAVVADAQVVENPRGHTSSHRVRAVENDVTRDRAAVDADEVCKRIRTVGRLAGWVAVRLGRSRLGPSPGSLRASGETCTCDRRQGSQAQQVESSLIVVLVLIIHLGEFTTVESRVRVIIGIIDRTRVEPCTFHGPSIGREAARGSRRQFRCDQGEVLRTVFTDAIAHNPVPERTGGELTGRRGGGQRKGAVLSSNAG